jgi:hypothetical protein
MKPLIILISSFFIIHVNAQVAISHPASTPDPSAMLDVKSTTGGLLFPRLNNTNKNAITSPPEGLTIYNTSFNRFEQYNGSVWKSFLDNDFWSRNGTTSPDERLHVNNGNVRTNNGNILFSESSGTGSKLISDYNGGNVNGYNHSIGFYDGSTRRAFLQYRKFDAIDEHRIEFGVASGVNNFSIQTNGVSYLSAENATLQLQSAVVDKGFVQLAGNDFRLGTNSSNTNGRFIIRSGSTDRFFVDGSGRVGIGLPATPGYALLGAGLMKGSANLRTTNITALSVEITTEVNNPSLTGTANMIPLYYGAVAAHGGCNCSASAITITNPFPGNYTISYPGMSGNDIVIVKPNEVDMRCSATYGSLGSAHPGFAVFMRSNSYSGGATYNADFSFIIFKQ